MNPRHGWPFSDRPAKEMSSGLLRPSEMGSTLGSEDVSMAKPISVPNGIPQPLVDSTSQTAKTYGDLASIGRDNPAELPHVLPKNGLQANRSLADYLLIYQNFLEAVSKSLSFKIAKSGKWLPLGSRSFIGPFSSPNDQIDAGGDRPYEVSHGLLRFSLLIELLPSGSLIIAGSPTLSRGLRKVCDVFDGESGNISTDVGVDVILAPSGDMYSYHGDVDTPTSLSLSTQMAPYGRVGQKLVPGKHNEGHLKALIISNLIEQGVKISPYERWIYLRPKEFTNRAGYDLGPRLLCESGSEFILWPASLCFLEGKKPSVEDVDMSCLHKLSQKTALHPLAYAEAWSRAKSAREEALKAALDKKLKEKELEARPAEELRSCDDQDTPRQSDTRVNQYLSTQDASQIYPTPPDGLRSELLGPSDTNNYQASRVGLEGNIRSTSGDDGEVPEDIQLPASPGFVVSSAHYEEATDDDLFGEIDTGLFATSGLTDADFSFFDERSEDEGIAENNNLHAEECKPPGAIEEKYNPQAIESGFHSPTEGVAVNLPYERLQNEEQFGFGSTTEDPQGDKILPQSLGQS